MILKVKEFQTACKTILDAVDTTTNSIVNETLELKVVDSVLSLNVTNKEYFTSVKMPVSSEENMIATVDAKVFLSLISKITTDELEITKKDNVLVIKGNGVYKLPMIYSDGSLLELTPIVIDNVTSDFVVNSDILHSILAYNSKELSKGVISRPIQKMYYVDEDGAITFTSGACVNSFKLVQPIKILLSGKIVKLFKLFPKNTDVRMILGYDDVGGITQTKVSFVSGAIEITAILNSDEDMLLSVPVSAIRGRANGTYKYSVDINRDQLIQAIDRLLVFSSQSVGATRSYARFKFGVETLTIKAKDSENEEFIDYLDCSTEVEEYETMLDLNDLKITLESCVESDLTLWFGDKQAIVIARGNIRNVIPEVHLV